MLPVFAYAPDPSSRNLWEQVGQRIHGAAMVPGERLDAAGDCAAILVDRQAVLRTTDIEGLLRAGKHVLLVDHPSHPQAEIAALVHAAKSSGAQLQIVNLNRYQPSRQLIKQRIASHLGPTGLVRSYRWEPAAEGSPGEIAELPAGLFDDLDLILWLFDEPVERVYALEHHLTGSPADAGRYLQLHLGFKLGMALLDYSNRLPAPQAYQSLSVIGFSGAAYAEDDENAQLSFRNGQSQALPPAARPVLARAALVQEFVDALATGRELTSTNACWQPVYALAAAVNQSLASRRAVTLEGR